MQKPDYQSRKPKPYHGKYAAKKPSTSLRTLCVMLACAMVLSLLAGGFAFQSARAEEAASGQCGPNLWWEFEGSTGILTIHGQGSMWDFERPEEAPWTGFSGSIRKIVFQSGVTVIGKNAFAGSAVEEIELPDTLTTIRQSAFQDCEQLTEVDASQTQLSSVEAKAFSGCQALRQDAVSMPAVTVVDETAFGEGVKEPSTPVETAPTVPSEPTTPSTTPTEPVETAPTEPEEPGRRTESFYSEKDYAQVTLTWENDVLVEKVMEYPYLNRVVSYTDFASEACPQTIVTTTNGKADTTVKREYDELGRLVNEVTTDTRTGTFVESFAVTYTSEKEGVCTLRDTLGEGDSTFSGDVTLYDNGAIKTVDFGCRYGFEFGRMQHSIVEYDEDGFIKRGVDIPASDADGWGRQEYTYLRNGALSGMTAYEYHNPDVVYATTECENTEKGIPVKQVYETANKDGDTGYHFKSEQDYDEIGQVTMYTNSSEAYGYKNGGFYTLYDGGKMVEIGYYDTEGNRQIQTSYSYYFDEETGCETTVREPGYVFYNGGTGDKNITVRYGTEIADWRTIYTDSEGVIRYELYDVNTFYSGYYPQLVELGTVAPDGSYIPDESEEPTEETTEPTTPTEEPAHPSDEYDAEGRLIKHYEYDAEGKLIEVKVYDVMGNQITSHKYEYDTEGNQIGHNIYDAEGNLFRSEKFDATGKPIGHDEYDIVGNLLESYKYEYDAENNLVGGNIYDAAGNLVESYRYKHDAAGNLIEGNIYDAEGNLIKCEMYNAQGNLTGRYEYDATGNLVESEKYEYDGLTILTVQEKYGADGKLIEYRKHDAEGNLIEHDEYDTKGNLLVSDRITVCIDEETGYKTTITTHLDGSKHKYLIEGENGLWHAIQTVYEYANEDGNIVTEVTFPDGSVIVTITDKDGNVIPQPEETTESTEETTEPTEDTTESPDENTEATEENTEYSEETRSPTGETTEKTIEFAEDAAA